MNKSRLFYNGNDFRSIAIVRTINHVGLSHKTASIKFAFFGGKVGLPAIYLTLKMPV